MWRLFNGLCEGRLIVIIYRLRLYISIFWHFTPYSCIIKPTELGRKFPSLNPLNNQILHMLGIQNSASFESGDKSGNQRLGIGSQHKGLICEFSDLVASPCSLYTNSWVIHKHIKHALLFREFYFVPCFNGFRYSHTGFPSKYPASYDSQFLSSNFGAHNFESFALLMTSKMRLYFGRTLFSELSLSLFLNSFIFEFLKTRFSGFLRFRNGSVWIDFCYKSLKTELRRF